MNNQVYHPPGEGWQRVRLKARLGPSLPAGTEGWATREGPENSRKWANSGSYRFVTLTNHELEFRIYTNEFDAH